MLSREAAWTTPSMMSLATISGQSCLAAMRHATPAVLDVSLHDVIGRKVHMHHKPCAFSV